ncbi:MAG: flagellar basal body-associated protein [Roseibaca calidilacus]|uniref:Flagellar protein FliL n=1 Tax=Roseibaca calidilacus TaxID=1666912 RepID=A0A0P8AMD8_9RHOB|nr:flagellar basal body-associated FliL family protein [Roseibaca calidilacus]KPP95847.1 MAG: flagellar basal body-associated protein [Roseibaca calidilacus]CUX81610.1 Flagellar basal body-associated protein FliL [Roseibaca calidilacus]
MAKILPILLMLLGLAGGAGAGFVLRPAPEPLPEGTQTEAAAPIEAPVTELYEFDGQFLVPLVAAGRVTSIVVIELALEVEASSSLAVADKEPLLRDRMLQILFDHANTGGFEGMFTAHNTLALLRKALLESAVQVMGDGVVFEVLITNILRNGA